MDNLDLPWSNVPFALGEVGRGLDLPQDDLTIRAAGDQGLLVSQQVEDRDAVGGGLGAPHDHGHHQARGGSHGNLLCVVFCTQAQAAAQARLRNGRDFGLGVGEWMQVGSGPGPNRGVLIRDDPAGFDGGLNVFQP